MNPTLLRALKGAPISTLIALRFLVTAGPLTLAQWTGYDRKTVAAALRALEGMGLTAAFGRYDSYRLTEHAETQLPLFLPSQLTDNISACREGENLPLDSHGGGDVKYSIDQGIEISITPMSREGENLPLDLLTNYLAKKTGYARRPIRKALAHALSQGDDPYQIETSMYAWLAYCKLHDGVKVPGALVAARLRDGEEAPRDCQERAHLLTCIDGWRSILDREPGDDEPDDEPNTGGYRVPAGYEDLISY